MVSAGALRARMQLGQVQRMGRTMCARPCASHAAVPAACSSVSGAHGPAAAIPYMQPMQPMQRCRLLRHGTSSALGCGVGSGLAQLVAPTGRALATMASASTAASTSGDTGAIVVYVTVPNQDTADSLSRVLVESELAACVNILPGVTSVYRWKGEVNRDAELLLIIKSRKSLLEELTAAVKKNHPYEEPEVISLPITGGSPSYLAWLLSSTKDA